MMRNLSKQFAMPLLALVLACGSPAPATTGPAASHTPVSPDNSDRPAPAADTAEVRPIATEPMSANASADEPVPAAEEAPTTEIAEPAVVPQVEPIPKPTKEEISQCAPAVAKIVEISKLIADEIHKTMRRKRARMIGKCKRRLRTGDAKFRKDLACVAGADGMEQLMRCEGWTDWPTM